MTRFTESFMEDRKTELLEWWETRKPQSWQGHTHTHRERERERERKNMLLYPLSRWYYQEAKFSKNEKKIKKSNKFFLSSSLSSSLSLSLSLWVKAGQQLRWHCYITEKYLYIAITHDISRYKHIEIHRNYVCHCMKMYTMYIRWLTYENASPINVFVWELFSSNTRER